MAYCIVRDDDGNCQFWRVIEGVPLEAGKPLPKDEYNLADENTDVVVAVFNDASNAAKLLEVIDRLDAISDGEAFGDGIRELLKAAGS